ncbi:unnamed protein product [Calicophoron daubneyi]|uniref:VHS domain-containing protein n=1 Tax=Calicophoron daubneyi TaxID=300641 RepID=A0AAV2TF53_CALDB
MNVASAISDLIHGNPFNTPVGNLVEEATEDFVSAELWQLFTQVCDAINYSPTGPKDAIRAIRRRFTTSVCTNETVAMHSLLLLETCMLNCGYRFHIVVITRDVLRDFTKFAVPEAEGVPVQIKQKILSLIQSWAGNFANQVDLQDVVAIYQEMKQRGVVFPELIKPKPKEPSKSNASPVAPTGDTSSALTAEPQTSEASTESAVPEPAARQSSEKVVRIPSALEKRKKLEADLAQVRVNVCVLSDLLTETEDLGSPPSLEAKLLMADISKALHEMSQRLIHAISCWEAYQDSIPNRTTIDSVLLDMIDVNDEVHTVLLRYRRLIRPEETRPSEAPPSAGSPKTAEKQDDTSTHANTNPPSAPPTSSNAVEKPGAIPGPATKTEPSPPPTSSNAVEKPGAIPGPATKTETGISSQTHAATNDVPLLGATGNSSPDFGSFVGGPELPAPTIPSPHAEPNQDALALEVPESSSKTKDSDKDAQLIDLG